MRQPSYHAVQWGDVEGAGYRVLAYTDGSLSIQRRDGADVFMQGDDARQLAGEIDDALRAPDPLRAMRDVLAAYDDVMRPTT